MGATIFTNQAVNVLQTASGPAFLLFEETYEKNCYPHTPRWGCVGIGRRDDVLRSIFNRAASTAGGMFRPKSRTTTAEAYIPRWDRALKNAISIQSRQVSVGKHTMPMLWAGETPPPPMTDEVYGPLDPSQAKDWEDGKSITLDLESDFDTIVWLWRTKRLSLWKVFKHDLSGHALDMSGEIFYPAAPKERHRPLPEFVRLFDSDSQLYLKDGTLLVAVGEDYEVMRKYVSEYAETEIRRPGHWKSNLRAYRKHIVDSTPVLDQSLVLDALVPMNCPSWELDWITRVQQSYPNGVHLGAVTGRPDRYKVARCPEFRIVS